MQKGIIKNVNKLTGEPIDAKDLASMLSGIIGNESGVLTVFDELRLEKISDNKVRLHSGVYSLKGHILYIPKGSYEDFEIESGTLGANRIDLLVAEYVKNGGGDGEDTLRFKIIKGEATSVQPQTPDLIQQDINSNGITRQEAIYQIRLKGTDLNTAKTAKNVPTAHKLDEKIRELDDRYVDYVVSREQKSGWYVEEWASGFVRMSKLFYLPARSFTALHGMYANGIRPADVNLDYPFNIGRVTHIEVQTQSGNTPNTGRAWVYEIENQTSKGIDKITFISPTNDTRTLRFSVFVEGYKPGRS